MKVVLPLLATLLACGGCHDKKRTPAPAGEEIVNVPHEIDVSASPTTRSDASTDGAQVSRTATGTLVDEKAIEVSRKFGVLEHLDQGATDAKVVPGGSLTEDQQKLIDEALETVHHEAKDMPELEH